MKEKSINERQKKGESLSKSCNSFFPTIIQLLTIYDVRKETIMIFNRVKWLSLLVVLAVLALGGFYALSGVQAAHPESENLVLEFDVAKDMTRFVFDESPVDEN